MATTESTDEEHGPTTPLRLDRATLYAKPNESFPDIPFKPLGRRGTQANLSDVRRGTVRLAKSIIDSLPNENGDFSPSITDASELDSFADKSYENARRRRFEALQASPVYSSYKRRSFDKNKLYTIPAPAGFYAERGTKAAPPFVKNYDKDIEARELAKEEVRAYADSNPYYEAGSVALPDVSDAAKQKEEYDSELRTWQQANPGYTEAALDAKRDELLKKYPRKDLTPTGLYGTSWHELMHMLTPNILRTNDSHIYSPYAGLGGDAGVESHGKDNKYYFSGLAEGAIPALSYKNMHGVLTGEDLSSEETSEGIYSKIEPLFKAFLDEKNVGNNSELLQHLGITQWAELDKHYREAAESKDATPDDIKNYNEWKKYVNYMIWLSKNNENAGDTEMETKTAAYRLGYNSFMSKRAGLVMPWEANRQEQAPASPKENVATAAKSVLTDMGYSFPQEQGEQPFGYSVSMTQPGSKPALAPYGANLQTRAGNLQKKWNTPGKKPDVVGAKTAEFMKKADPPHKGVNSPFYSPGEYDPMLDPEIFAYQPVPRKRGVLLPLKNSRAGKEWTRILDRGAYIDPSKTMTGRYLSWLPDTPENADKRRALSVDLNPYISTVSRDVAARLIAGGEDYKKNAYKPLKNSNWTYGYGFEYKPDENWHMSKVRVGPGDTISREDANKYLKQLTWDMLEKARVGTKDWNTATYGERAALASYLYNKAGNVFLPSIADRLKKGGESLAKIIGEEFPKFVKAKGIPIPGLVNRRLKEIAAAGVPDDQVVMSPAANSVDHISYDQAKKDSPALTRKDMFNYAGDK